MKDFTLPREIEGLWVIGINRLFLSLTVSKKKAVLIIFCHLYVTDLVKEEGSKLGVK
jgi:hypothetical protein